MGHEQVQRDGRASGNAGRRRDAGAVSARAGFLLSLQQHAGNRAVASLAQNRRDRLSQTRLAPVVQRKVGFEFEVSSPLHHEHPTRTNFLTGDPERVSTNFPKDKKLHDQNEFHIVQDHTAIPIEGVKTIPEFVIHPAEESLPLDAFLQNVKAAQAFVSEVDGRGGKRRFDTTPNPAFISELRPTRSGGAQATFGVLPEGIPDLFSGKKERFKERNVPLHEAEILEAANAAATKVIEHQSLKDADEKEKIRGFLALICSYCVSNSIQELQTGDKVVVLDKNKVPFLVRSTMGEIAQKTLGGRSRELLANNNVALAELIIEATGAKGDTPIISPTSSEPNKDPNVDALPWVRTALAGNDAPLKWGSVTAGVDSKLIPPEQVGKPPEGGGVGARDERRFGAVVEERNLVQGEVSVQNWHEVAAATWGDVRKANRLA